MGFKFGFGDGINPIFLGAVLKDNVTSRSLRIYDGGFWLCVETRLSGKFLAYCLFENGIHLSLALMTQLKRARRA